ncbi:MAG: Trk system potassium transporter TrkA [Lachnospiraceae bacterium]|jgi:trk system potassium uptake protein TrkA
MKIMIIGLGKVGAALAEQLSAEGHDITVVDKDRSVVTKVTNQWDVRGSIGNGVSAETQKEAGIQDTDLMIAVTGEDEINLLCCLIAKKLGNCMTICRVRNPIYHKEVQYLQQELGLALVINPELTTAKAMASLLRFPSAIDIDTFARGKIELLRFSLSGDSPLVNHQIRDISSLSSCDVLVCIVERGDRVMIPDGSVELQAGDKISVVMSAGNAHKFFEMIHIPNDQVHNTMIVGGGKISYYLARLLMEMNISVKIIEKKPDKCADLAEKLPKATIICGDGTNRGLLDEEGIHETEGFAALTDMDEENIMLSLYAGKVSSAKTITKISNTSDDPIVDSLNLGSVIYPKNLVTENIVSFVRALQNTVGSKVETMYRLVNGQAEALEFTIREESRVTNIPLAQLKTRQNLLLCAIYRNNQTILPRGADTIQVGDRVVVITTNLGLRDIDDILA